MPLNDHPLNDNTAAPPPLITEVLALEKQLAEYKLSTQILFAATETLAEGMDTRALAQRALKLICQALTILRGEIFTVSDVGELALLAVNGYTDEQALLLQERLAEMRLQKGLAKAVTQKNQPIVLPDINCSEDWLPIPNLDDDICSAAALPMRINGKLVGVISLLSNEPDYFTEPRLAQLNALILPIALALHTAKLFYEVEHGQQALHLLAANLVSTQEEERKRIAHELHDETGQALAGIKGSLLSLQATLPETTALLTQQLGLAITLADQTMTHIRRLAYGLRPPMLDLLGLDAALQRLCVDFMQQTKIKTAYQGCELAQLPDEIGISLYRFVEEALNNVVRHAVATHIQVQIETNQAQIVVAVHDDGRGFPPEPSSSGSSSTVLARGLGLLELRERFEPLGGKLQIDSSPAGVSVVATIPWSANKPNH